MPPITTLKQVHTHAEGSGYVKQTTSAPDAASTATEKVAPKLAQWPPGVGGTSAPDSWSTAGSAAQMGRSDNKFEKRLGSSSVTTSSVQQTSWDLGNDRGLSDRVDQDIMDDASVYLQNTGGTSTVGDFKKDLVAEMVTHGVGQKDAQAIVDQFVAQDFAGAGDDMKLGQAMAFGSDEAVNREGQAGETTLTQAKPVLHNVDLFPNGGMPSASDINQRGIGDCNGLSAMAALANQYPQLIKDSIAPSNPQKDASNPTFDVKMFDPSGSPITVQVDSRFVSSDQGDLIGVQGKDKGANWGSVLESAIYKYNQMYGTGTESYGGVNAIAPTTVWGAMMGPSADRPIEVGSQSSSELASSIENALASGGVMTGGFSEEIEAPNGDKMLKGHGYAVTGVVTQDGQQYVSVRNPWGAAPNGSSNNEKDDGVTLIPIDVFQKYGDLRIADPGPAVAGQKGSNKTLMPAEKTKIDDPPSDGPGFFK